LPKRTLLFAFFCGEEQYLRGSLDYTVFGKPLFPIKDTKLMIQVDYIGEGDGPYLTNLDDNPMVTAFVGDETQALDMPIAGLDWAGQAASDDYGFLYRKVPAYRFISYGDYHHLDTDTFDRLSIPIIQRVADVSIRGMVRAGY
jgi:Zn-dependent M28 family amino/carboxypeptidase